MLIWNVWAGLLGDCRYTASHHISPFLAVCKYTSVCMQMNLFRSAGSISPNGGVG